MTRLIGHSTARGLVGTFSASSTNAVTGILTGILVARWLSADARGEVAIVMFWPMLLASFGQLSVTAAIVYHIARAPADCHASLRATAVALSVGLALATTAVSFAIVPLVVKDTAVVELCRLYAAAIMIPHFVGLVLVSADQGEMRFGRYNVARLIPQGVYAVCLIGLALRDDMSVRNVLAAQAMGTLAVVLFYVAGSWREMRAPIGLYASKDLLRTGLGQHASVVVSTIRAQADRMIAIALLSDAEIGLYVIAGALALTPVNIVVGSLAALLVPRLSRERSVTEKNRILTLTFRNAAAGLSVITPLIVLATPFILPTVFGVQYSRAVPTAQIYAGAAFLIGLQTVVFEALRGYNALRLRFAAETIFLACGMLLFRVMYIQTPEEMAIWLAATTATTLLLTLALICRAFGLPPQAFNFLTLRTYSELGRTILESVAHSRLLRWRIR